MIYNNLLIERNLKADEHFGKMKRDGSCLGLGKLSCKGVDFVLGKYEGVSVYRIFWKGKIDS